MPQQFFAHFVSENIRKSPCPVGRASVAHPMLLNEARKARSLVILNSRVLGVMSYTSGQYAFGGFIGSSPHCSSNVLANTAAVILFTMIYSYIRKSAGTESSLTDVRFVVFLERAMK